MLSKTLSIMLPLGLVTVSPNTWLLELKSPSRRKGLGNWLIKPLISFSVNGTNGRYIQQIVYHLSRKILTATACRLVYRVIV